MRDLVLEGLSLRTINLHSASAVREVIPSWIMAIEKFENTLDFKSALTLTVELAKVTAKNHAGAQFRAPLLIKVLKLSNLLREIELYEQYETEVQLISTENLLAELANCDTLTDLAYIRLSESQSILGQHPGQGHSATEAATLCYKLSKANADRLAGLVNLLANFEKVKYIDCLLEMITSEPEEPQRIQLKNHVYAAIILNRPLTHVDLLQELESVAARLSALDNWSAPVRHLNHLEYASIQEAMKDQADGVSSNPEAQNSVAGISSSFLAFMLHNIDNMPLNNVRGLLDNYVLISTVKLSTPEVFNAISFEIRTLQRLGFTNSTPINFDSSGTRFHPTSYLARYADVYGNILRGDNLATELSFEIAKSQSGDLSEPEQLFQELTEFIISTFTFHPRRNDFRKNLDVFFEVGKIGNNFTCVLLKSGIQAFGAIAQLHLKVSEVTSDEETNLLYEKMKINLRNIHKQYGSRNVFFVSVSLSILKWEILHHPLPASNRIRSLFNLFKLIKFENKELLSNMYIEQISLLNKLGDDKLAIEGAIALVELTESTMDLSHKALAFSAMLRSSANIGELDPERLARYPEITNWIETQRSNLSSNEQINLAINQIRFLTVQQQIREALDLAIYTLSKLPDGYDQQRRLLTTYLAVLSHQQNEHLVETEAWAKLAGSQNGKGAIFYKLQSSRNLNHTRDSNDNIR